MHPSTRRLIVICLALVSLLAALPLNSTAAQDNPPPVQVDLPCATNISVQVLGRTPVHDGEQDLVLVRIHWGPGGSIEAHTHPGTLWVVVESGQFGLTLLEDGEMSVTRAATADTEATVEPIAQDEEVVLEAGDGFAEMGMVHSARNMGDETITTIFSGLVEPGQPLTSCAEEAAQTVSGGQPPANVGGSLAGPSQ